MLPDPLMAYRLGQERMKDALCHAEQARLMREAEFGRSGRVARGVAGIGGLLVAAGERLQGQHAPARTGLPTS